MPRRERTSAISARMVAARVLERVVKDGAYAAAALDAELERHAQLDARERALATELVYGCLRTRRVLLEHVARHAPRGVKDAAVETHLVIAAYQLLILERIPPFAAVDAAVEAVRGLRGARVAGFANAVLRRLAAEGAHLERASAIVESAPRWLFERLAGAVGDSEARALLGAGRDEQPPTCLRVSETVGSPAWLTEAERGRASPLARLVTGGDPRRREGYREGAFVVQEEGAQVVALALGARPGDRVLDACAGRGQKTLLFSGRVGAAGVVWATDLYPSKLEVLAREAERLGVAEPRTAAVDYTLGTAEVPGDFDRVLVDAPCTGVGTLRRRPEIALRLEPDAPARLGELAHQILRRAATRARAGGRVVFAVCSVLREESEEVVERVLDVLEPTPFDAPELRGLVGEGATSFRLLPGRHGTDGYFVASFARR
ncbi:MAG: Sun protein [Sorangiineae bacterium]|nr:Sun protein [Polyangiaceae bacterium]MEB2323911.1 Sun protein [Sorangiineae bacterium]